LAAQKAQDQAMRQAIYKERMGVLSQAAENLEAKERWEKEYDLKVQEAKNAADYRAEMLSLQKQKSEADALPKDFDEYIVGQLPTPDRDMTIPEAVAAHRLWSKSGSTATEKIPPDLSQAFVTGYEKRVDDWESARNDWIKANKPLIEPASGYVPPPYLVEKPSSRAYFDALIRPRAETLGLSADSIAHKLAAYYPDLLSKDNGGDGTGLPDMTTAYINMPLKGPGAQQGGGGLTAEEEDAAKKIRAWQAANPGKPFKWDAAQKDYPNLRMDQIKARLTP